MNQILVTSLKNKNLNSSIYFAFSSSEEVGLRGGKTAASLINPNIAFVIDVVSAKNVFDNSSLNTRKNGNGFLIEVYDKTFIPSVPNSLEIKLNLSNAVSLYFNDSFSKAFIPSSPYLLPISSIMLGLKNFKLFFAKLS